jgi:hypothetical protein
MQKRRGRAAHKPPEDRTVAEFYQHGRTRIEAGRELSITGERGRFRFRAHVVTGDGREWLDVIGGPEGSPAFRAFRPDRIKTVHRIAKTRANAKKGA